MADENKDVQHFALGLIVAAIIFLFLRRELFKANSVGAGTGAGSRLTASEKASGGCGCGGGKPELVGPQANATSPKISVGGQSYNNGGAFAGTSVTVNRPIAGVGAQ